MIAEYLYMSKVPLGHNVSLCLSDYNSDQLLGLSMMLYVRCTRSHHS